MLFHLIKRRKTGSEKYFKKNHQDTCKNPNVLYICGAENVKYQQKI